MGHQTPAREPREYIPGFGFARGPQVTEQCYEDLNTRIKRVDEQIIEENKLRLGVLLNTDLKSELCDIAFTGEERDISDRTVRDLYKTAILLDTHKGNILGFGENNRLKVYGVHPDEELESELLVTVRYPQHNGAAAIWQYFIEDLEDADSDLWQLGSERALENLEATLVAVNTEAAQS